MRRWHEGDTVEIPNSPLFRVVAGIKKPGDLRIDWWSSGRNTWLPINMSVAAVLTDFFCENEEHLYPQRKGLAGERYFKGYLELAASEGWEVADRKLRTEQRLKRAQ